MLITKVILVLIVMFTAASSSGQQMETIFEVGHSGHVTSLDFHPSKRLLASGGRDYTVKIWDLDNWTIRRTLPNHSGTVYVVKFSPDGRYLLTGDSSNVVKWDYETGERLATYQIDCSYISKVAFIDEHRFVTGCAGNMTVRNLNDPAQKRDFGVITPGWSLQDIDVSGDGRFVLYSVGKYLELYDLQLDRFVFRQDHESNIVRHVGLLNNLVVTTHTDNTLNVFNLKNSRNTYRKKLPERINKVVMDHKTSSVIAFSDHKIFHYSVSDEKLETYAKSAKHKPAISLAQSRPYNLYATGGYDNIIRLWEFDGQYTHLGTLGSIIPESTAIRFYRNDLIIGNSAGEIIRVNTTSGKVNTLLTLKSSIDGLQIKDDLLAIRANGKATIFDLETNTTKFTVGERGQRISSVGFSPDSKHLVTASNKVSFWNLGTGNIEFSLTKDHASIGDFKFGKTTGQLLTTNNSINDWENRIHIWDIDSPEQVRLLEGHTDSVTQAEYSSTGQFIYSASMDNSLLKWNANSGQIVQRFVDPNLITFSGKSHEHTTFDFVQIPESNTIVTAGFQDGYLKQWNSHTGKLISSENISRFIKGIKLIKQENDLLTLFVMEYDGSIAHVSNFADQFHNTINALRLSQPLKPPIKGASSFDIFRDGRTLAVGSSTGQLAVFSIHDLSEIRQIKAFDSYISKVLFLGNSNLVAATALDSSNIVILDTSTGEKTIIDTGHTNRITDIKYQSKDNLFVTSAADGTVKSVSLQGNTTDLYTFQTGGIYSTTQNPIHQTMYLSSGGGRKNRDLVKYWEVKPGGKSETVLTGTYRGAEVAYHQQQDFFAINDGLNISYLRIFPQRQNLSSHPASARKIQFLQNGHYYLGANSKYVALYRLNGTLKTRYQGISGNISDLHASNDSNYIGASTVEGWNYLWNVNKPQEFIKIYTSNNKVLMLDKQGYYFGDKSLLKNVRFKSGDQSFSFEQFDLIKNRPDKIIAQLPNSDPKLVEIYRAAYQSRLHFYDLNDTTDNFLHIAPVVAITNSESLPLATKKSQIELKLSISSDQSLLDRLYVTVNGSTIGGPSHGIKLESSQNIETTIPVNLSNGTNRIVITALNHAGLESERKNIQIKHIGHSLTSKLYVVSIGVSNYQSASDKLVYPSIDATFLSQSLQKGIPDSKHMLLTDEIVHASSLVEIENFIENAMENDKILVFLSGHGIVRDGMYYFMPAGASYDTTTTRGISYAALSRILGKVRSRNKLLIINTCYSGEFSEVETKQELEAFNLMTSLYADLHRSSGATVIAAAEGRSTSKEVVGSRKRNGMMVSVIVKALYGGQPTKISDLVKEFNTAAKRKSIFSRKAINSPKLREINLSNDFHLW